MDSYKEAGKSVNKNLEHFSGETADHGFKFQLEILFNLCLQIYHLDCKKFSLGFEVSEIDKLDDIVVDCEINERKFAFFLQAKHSATKNQVFLNNFFSVNKEGGSKKFWKKYNLRQFVEALMLISVQRSMEKYNDHTKRYVIVTNNSIKTDNVETIVENCLEFNEIFRKFIESGAVVVKFGLAFQNPMLKIVEAIKENAEKDGKNVYLLDTKYLLDNIVVLSNLPNHEDLEEVSDKFVKIIFEDNHSDLLAKFLRQNVINFIKPVDKKRKFINRNNFMEIIEISKLEVELTRMTEALFQQIKFVVKYDKEILEKFRSDLSGCRIIQLEGHNILSVLKVYDALKHSEVKVFLLQLSLVKKNYKNFCKLPKSKIIIYVDCAKNWKELLRYENVVIIGGEQMLKDVAFDQKIIMRKPSFEEFNEDTRNAFLRKTVKIQGYPVKLDQIRTLIFDDPFFKFVNDLSEELTIKDFIEFGNRLPEEGKFYIMRYFSQSQTLNDHDLLDRFSNAIIEADPGMGKTSTAVKLARQFKSVNPHYWVSVLYLTDFTGIFHKMQLNDMISIDHIEDILTSGHQYQEFCKKLLKIYLNHKKNVPIFIFFDGFDEIYPEYNTIFLNLIDKLNQMNIRIFITTRTHCLRSLKSLKNFSVIQMQLFKDFQRNIFIRRYVELAYPDSPLENIITGINQKILSSEKFDEKLLGTPMLLKMIIDIYKKSPEFAVNLDKLNIFKIYDGIFKMSFDNYYAKEKLDPTLNVITSKRNLEEKRVKEIYSYLAILEMNLKGEFYQDDIEFNETEIIARGFITKSAESGYKFIHRTFAEYFAGEAIVAKIVKKNVYWMKYINQHPDELMCQFAYFSILYKLQKNSLEFEGVEKLTDFCEIFQHLYFKRQMSVLSEFITVIENIDLKLSRGEMMDFLIYQMKFFKNFNQDHIDFLLEFLEERYDASILNSFLSGLESKNFSDVKYFHTIFQNLLISRGILSESQSFEKIYCDFVAQYWTNSSINFVNMMNFMRRNSNYSKEIYFAMFANRIKTIAEDVEQKILSKYDKIDAFDTHDVVLINYLALYLENSCSFLQNLLTFFHKRKIIMQFFSKLSRIHFQTDCSIENPFKVQNLNLEDCEEFIKMCIKIFEDNQWINDKFEDKTLLFYCWTSEDTMIMTIFLKYLPLQTIVNLASSPNFNGKSAIEFYHTEEDPIGLPLNYLEYLYKNFDRNYLFGLIVPFKKDISCKAYFKNIDLYHNLYCSKKNNVIDHQLFSKMVEKIIEEILKEAQETRVNLLYPLACNFEYIGLSYSFIEGFFAQLSKYFSNFGGQRNYLEHSIKQIDDNGNNLFHIAAKNDNNYFIEYIRKQLPKAEVTECLKMKNNIGQNYFHCLKEHFPIWKKNKQIDQDDLQEMLLEQDHTGKTPFHCTNSGFFENFCSKINDDAVVVALTLKDVHQNNILHYWARNPDPSDRTDLRVYLSLVVSPMIKEAIKKALLEVNAEGKTPKDLGLNLKIDR